MERTRQAVRPGTRANQHTHTLLYVAFTIFFALQDFPADVATLLLFAEFLLRGFRAPKSVTNAVSSVKVFHLWHGFDVGAFHHHRWDQFKRALPLTVRHVPAPAPPLPFELLVTLCAQARDRGPQGLLFAALFSTLFFTMARVSSLLPPRVGVFDGSRYPTLADVRGGNDGLEFQLKWGKNFQNAADAFWVPLLPLRGSPACPVANLRRWLSLLGTLPANAPLFSLPPVAGSTAFPAHLALPLAKDWLAALLKVACPTGQAYTFHSFRRGACTLAFRGGAELDDLRQLGGWRSDAVLCYRPAFDARRRAARVLVRAAT